jgi:endonuclease/exonuclease/phosphatase family metal-dependent hydrolase
MTYNIHRWGVSPQEFSELLDQVRPDLVAIQECAPSRWKVPPEWHVERGVYSLVVSRYPITKVEKSRREHEVNGLYCVVAAPAGPIGFCCVDLLTPRRALDKVLDSETIFDLTQTNAATKRIDFRWQESEQLSSLLKQFPESKIIACDFNLTTDSPIYRKFWSAYDNAFSRSEFGFGHTKKTKINIFRYTSRIDHILSTTDFLPLRCWIGPDFGSDHLPVIAEFALD